MLGAILDVLRMPARARDVLGVNARNLTLIHPLNPRRYYPLADDKILTKGLLVAAGVPVPATLAEFSTLLDASRSAAALAPFDEIVIKPAGGRAGNGILILASRRAPGWLDAAGKLHTPADINRHVSNIIFGNYAHGLSDRALVEERVQQAPLLGPDLLPGLPDIRVITLDAVPLLAMVRLPTLQSGGRANLHQGAVGVGIDLESGRTTHAILRGRAIQVHPDTGAGLVGAGIARWPDVLDVASRAARALPLGYLGMDVAVDARRGPLVMEANVRPGLEIQNANRTGLRRIATAVRAGLAR